jgi:hypothetical protein
MNLRITFIIIIGLISQFPGKSLCASGYNALLSYGDGFIAAGTDGRIDWFSTSGNIIKSEKYPDEQLNCLLVTNQLMIVAGNKGSILLSSNNETFRKVNSGTDKNIHSLAFFKEMILAGSDQGELLIGDEKGIFRKIQLALKGNLVSLSTNNTVCYGVTDQGEIIHSTDGVNWTVLDFNEFYKGYYKPCRFTSVLVTDNRIAAAGKHEDGTPALLFSSQGNVWTERTLNYTDDQGIPALLEDIPYDLHYNPIDDQFLLCCSTGKVMIIPTCSHCNKFYEYTKSDLKCIAGNENTLMIAGDNYFIKVIECK